MNGKPGALSLPACAFLALLEYPQYLRHVLHLPDLVAFLILGEPPQIFPIGGLVHIPGPLRCPCAEAESIGPHSGPCVQVFVYQVTAFTIKIHTARSGLLL